MNSRKTLLLLALVVLLCAFWLLDLQRLLDPAFLAAQRDSLFAFRDEHFWLSSALYFLSYVAVAALSLPAAALLTLAGGAVFGFWWGLLLVSFASSIGATLAFLMARTLLHDWVQQRYGAKLEPINRGIAQDGAYYLFTLRLIPLVPFFLVNLLMGLTPMRTLTFYAVSQAGMLFGTALYVNLGAQLGLVDSIPGVLSVGVLRAIVILALFPWLAKALLGWRRRRKLLRGFKRPRRFDANLIVIGAGSAGLVSSYIAALAKAKVILVEQNRMGGDCLNTGCVPSKSLLRSAAIRQLAGRAAEFGIRIDKVEVDFAGVMQHLRKVITRIEPHDSVERYTQLGVECLQGKARIVSPWCVEVDGKPLTTRGIILATGARPLLPPIPGLTDVDARSSDTIWDLPALPRRLLVLGAGPVGCELAQAFARLGSEVTLVNRRERLLPTEDPEVSALVEAGLAEDGIAVRRGTEIVSCSRQADGSGSAQLSTGEQLEFDVLLLAVGRSPNIEGLGLEALGVLDEETGSLSVDARLQTACPTIFACGDVVGPYRFTHMASFQAWYASINTLFGFLRRFRIAYRVVPRAVFTDPEVARVGINEKEAQEQGIRYELSRWSLAELDRAIADGNARGEIKVLTAPGTDRLLGVTITGTHAADSLTQFTLAMTHGLGLKKVLSTIHLYPGYAESGKFVAGVWRKNHAPRWVYPWLERLHRWRRNQ